MSWGVVAVAGAGLVTGYMSSEASKDAASTEANAANNASGIMQNQYNLSRQDMQPWLTSGKNALSQLNQQLPNLTRNFSAADFQQDPGYQFNLQQGQQAIERSAAARGGGIGGSGTMKSLLDYSQGMASNEYQNAFNRFNTNQSNAFNRLASMSGVGQQAAQQNGSNGLQSASQIGQNTMAAGNAMAAGTVGQANAINNAVGTTGNLWMQNQMLNRMGPQSYSSVNDPSANWHPQQLTQPSLGGY